jgi:hypothetical protein
VEYDRAQAPFRIQLQSEEKLSGRDSRIISYDEVAEIIMKWLTGVP